MQVGRYVTGDKCCIDLYGFIPTHTAYAVVDWFIEMGIPLADHPLFSLDMNPIEHIWFHLKKQVLLLYPKLTNIGKGEADL